MNIGASSFYVIVYKQREPSHGFKNGVCNFEVNQGGGGNADIISNKILL